MSDEMTSEQQFENAMTIIEYGKEHGNYWEPSRGGQARYYLNDWYHLAGWRFSFYNTGNVAAAYLDGEETSNTHGSRYAFLSVWVGAEDGEVHVQGGDPVRTNRKWVQERITKAILRLKDKEA